MAEISTKAVNSKKQTVEQSWEDDHPEVVYQQWLANGGNEGQAKRNKQEARRCLLAFALFGLFVVLILL